ncbi:MAG TPA: farnesyl diphosphate synthase [Burkholderiaceae bacterium]|nr:farnesyl diphosphate synthase [Burkholderiaceae bacterium]
MAPGEVQAAFDFALWSGASLARAEAALEAALPAQATVPSHLHEAMRYAVMGGGKRVRALLVTASAEFARCPAPLADAMAVAIELIHAYSLVHDDLPAMDNDELRRGKPTVWKQFGEAQAVLVGDALQSSAFELLARACQAHPKCDGLAVLQLLAQASGSQGMCGGQAIDLASEGKQLALAELEQLHRMKTGALLVASVMMPALAMRLPPAQQDALERFARTVGLAFQVADDVLDATADSATLGKTAGKDAEQGKATYVSLLGLDEARRRAEALRLQAHQHLDGLGPTQADGLHALAALADLIVRRTH